MFTSIDTFLNALSDAPLLRHVGEPIEDSSIIQVYSWAEALKSCRAQAWEDFLIDRHNEYIHPVAMDQDLSRAYVEIVRKVLPTLNAVFEKAATSAKLVPKDVATVLRYGPWITLRACDQIAHADRYEHYWYRDVSQWLLEGHFICGYEGDWPEGGEPNGKLVIF
jgi:hypothetical protein